ncbi:glycosyltransferase family 2 protein [Terrimesophilobacter mesophilus]|uniref:Glycosyltransferase family 2 protein n=2 Tax=Terrimesophilobacter mesophilus TaxID=433647 RepID=A0A4R8VE40_9MICO|nr:glycosyltransferase family 2 protein [Terrimesophilobacter mesophilus]
MPFVREQLRSILHQSQPPAQLVVSDDASSDGTVSAVKDIMSRFRAERPTEGVALTLLENAAPLGVTANFEQAVLACTGEFIALCDQDDSWVPERLAAATARFMAEPGLLLLFSDARLVNAEGEPLGENLFEAIGFSAREKREVHGGRALDTLLRRNVVTGATTVFRRSLLESAVPFPAEWVHDEWLAIMAAVVGRIDFLPDALVDYRQHGKNHIGAGSPSGAELVGRLREPGTARNKRLLGRARAFAGRLAAMGGVDRELVRGAEAKLAHEYARSGYPRSRFLRLGPVVLEAATGRYGRYGRARYDIPRDLFQPR